jgi:hypothetical protein
MYGLRPEDIKHLSHLEQASLIQVCVGQYQLVFNFHPAGTIAVEGRCELLDDGGLDIWDRGERSERFRFLELLGESVVAVTIDSPRSFKLAFSNRRSLRVVDNSDLYESFSVDGLCV